MFMILLLLLKITFHAHDHDYLVTVKKEMEVDIHELQKSVTKWMMIVTDKLIMALNCQTFIVIKMEMDGLMEQSETIV